MKIVKRFIKNNVIGKFIFSIVVIVMTVISLNAKDIVILKQDGKNVVQVEIKLLPNPGLSSTPIMMKLSEGVGELYIEELENSKICNGLLKGGALIEGCYVVKIYYNDNSVDEFGIDGIEGLISWRNKKTKYQNERFLHYLRDSVFRYMINNKIRLGK